MRKTFLRLTLLACIGAIFSIGLVLVSVSKNSVVNAGSGGASDVYTVDINTGNVNLLTNELIITKVINPVVNSEPKEYLGVKNLTDVEEGTVINITAKSDSLFVFKKFVHYLEDAEIADSVDGTGSELRFVVERNISIELVFVENSISPKLIISGLCGVEEVDLKNSIRVSIDDNPGNDPVGDDETPVSEKDGIDGVVRNYKDYALTGISIKPGQELEYIAFDGLEGYKFKDVLIKPKGSDYHSFKLSSLTDNANSDRKEINGNTITYFYYKIFNTIFFDEYLSNESEILLVINFEKTCKVTFVYSTEMANQPIVDEQLPGGTWNNNVDINKFFDVGTKIRVTAKAKDYNTFTGFDRTKVEDTGITQIFDIFDTRTINLHFKANTYKIQSNLSTSVSKTEFRVGEIITFTYDVSSMKTIKDWKLYNSDKTKNFGADIEKRSGNSVTITLTGDMLKDGKFVLEHEVSDSIKSAILVGIAVPSTVIPLLLIIMAVFIITDIKRKKVIKAALEGKWENLKKRDVGGFIAAVREGATGEVSKEDIKKAMKEQKEAKKNEPKVKAEAAPKVKAEPTKPEPKVKEAAAPAPKKVAAKPAPTVSAANLIGAKIMPDRSIVIGNNVIGNLQTDATIKDMAGKVFASARLNDGAILDMSGNAIGKITGDGTIAKL